MKHAVLIIAHNESNHLLRLISYFERDCYIFVHLDKKKNFTDDYVKIIQSMDNVIKVYRKYSLHWGGFSILRCEMFLLKEALNLCDAAYFHFLSGQDYPIRPLDTFLKVFEQRKDMDYIKYVRLPHPLWQNATFRRFQYFFPFDFFKNPKESNILKKIMNIQIKVGIKRAIPRSFDNIYGASQWCSITRETSKLIIKNTQSSFYKRMRFVFAPDEIYIPTIVCNNIDKNKITDNRRIVLWGKYRADSPLTLELKHFRTLICNECVIARKFSSGISDDLVYNIDKYLINDPEIQSMNNGGWDYNGFLKYDYNEFIFRQILFYIKAAEISDGIDVGCGVGIYVMKFRDYGIPMTGCDANPHTEELSSLILHPDDTLCQTLDITDEIECEDLFDLVLCMDVLSYIPSELLSKAMNNLMKLSRKSIIISFKNGEEELLTQAIWYFENHGFKYNRTFSNSFSIGKKSNYIFGVMEIIDDKNINEYV